MKTDSIYLNQNHVRDYNRYIYFMKNFFERACNKVIRHTKWYEQYWNGVQKFWYLNRFNLDVVNLGSNSGKYAFNYEGLDIAGMNWAVGPQSLVHDFNILKNYFSYLRNGATVIIAITPFSSLVSPNYNKGTNLKYYTFLHPATILNFDENERIKALGIKESPVRELPWLCIKRTFKEGIKCVIHKPLPKCDMEKNATIFIDSWKKQFGITDLDTPLSEHHSNDQKNRIQVLRDMIDFCLERDLKPVLVIPPVHSALGKRLTEKCRENYIYSFVKKANERNVPFLDYMDDGRFQNDGYFLNSFFMSEDGAKTFTKIVLKDLNIL